MLIDMVVLGFICVILAPVGPFFKTTVQSLLRRLRLIHAIASAAERLRSYGQPGSNPAGEELAYRKIDTGHCFRGTPAWAPRNSFACN